MIGLIYLMAVQASGQHFSFELVPEMHRSFWYLYLMDALPLAGLLTGISLGRSRFLHLDRMQEKIKSETRKNEEISRFTSTLIAGELGSGFAFKELDPGLSESLNKLKDALIRNREVERQRRLDERQRNWTSEGLAQFGDILRMHSQEMEPMAYEVVSTLVRYLNANQGALYLTEEQDSHKQLRMVACYAYERKKFPGEVIAWGDGLIGAAAVEKLPYYTDKIPQGYLSITSGLGKANPNYLLIEPLVWNERVFGVLELASFKDLEVHARQFVSRVAESIATTIQTMQSNLRTEHLLKETQAQAKQLASQEEQGRQNMEALRSAQAEAAKQAEIFISFTNTVNHTLLRAEYSTDGSLMYANTRFLKKLGYAGFREVDGRHISMFIHEKDRNWFKGLWEKLASGGRHFEGYMKHETKLGQDLWTMATYTCMRRDDGEVEKILFLAIDSTEQKKQSLDYEGQIAAIDRLNAKAIFAPDGKLMLSNERFASSLKYPEQELEHMRIFDFFGRGEQERFNEVWEQVIQGEAFQGQLKLNSKYEEDTWFRAALLSVMDMYGEVEKVVLLANEITKEKDMEQASRLQHEQLVKKEEELRLTSLDLQRKLEERQRKHQEQKTRFERDIRQYRHVMELLPQPLLSIDNLGFVHFMNKSAEKLFGAKASDVLEKQVGDLLGTAQESEILRTFVNPARKNTPGIHHSQVLVHEDGTRSEHDLLLISTDLKEELHFTLVFL